MFEVGVTKVSKFKDRLAKMMRPFNTETCFVTNRGLMLAAHHHNALVIICQINTKLVVIFDKINSQSPQSECNGAQYKERYSITVLNLIGNIRNSHKLTGKCKIQYVLLFESNRSK